MLHASMFPSMISKAATTILHLCPFHRRTSWNLQSRPTPRFHFYVPEKMLVPQCKKITLKIAKGSGENPWTASCSFGISGVISDALCWRSSSWRWLREPQMRTSQSAPPVATNLPHGENFMHQMGFFDALASNDWIGFISLKRRSRDLNKTLLSENHQEVYKMGLGHYGFRGTVAAVIVLPIFFLHKYFIHWLKIIKKDILKLH